MAETETAKILREQGYEPPKDSPPDPSSGASRAKTAGKAAEDPATGEKKRTPKWRKMGDQLAEMYGMAAMAIQSTGNQFEAQIIAQAAQPLAAGWVDLAENNPAVARVIEKLTSGGQWGNVIMSHMMIALPILAHRGIGPAPFVENFRTMNTLQYGVTYEARTPPSPNGAGLFQDTATGEGPRVGAN